MKVLKIWFLGTLALQVLIWTYTFILSTVEPAAAWLVFYAIYALLLCGVQFPIMAITYDFVKNRVEAWKWWHSFLLWIGSFALILLPAYLLFI